MPEDSNPGLDKNSRLNYLFFTLPMALNYQRNSYKLWENAQKTFLDDEVKDVFLPEKVVEMSEEELRFKLIKHKVAIQPNKQPEIWRTISNTLKTHYKCDVRELFTESSHSVKDLLNTVQKKYKKGFPYLSGNKICNYWLYIMDQYTEASLKDKEFLNIAPDTHIIQSSIKLGVIDENSLSASQIQKETAVRWREILKDTEFAPIDMHTPLWLWSRSDFAEI